MGIEIIDTLSQKNNGNFPLVDSNDIRGGYYQVDSLIERDNIPFERRKEGMLCYVKNDKIYHLSSGINNDGWVEFQAGGTTGDCEIYVGVDEPVNSEYEVWIDTSDNEQITEDISDLIITEFREVIDFLKNEINSLKATVLEHEARISYLEINGGGGGTIPPDPEPNDGMSLTFEDGTIMTFEDGNIMIFE